MKKLYFTLLALMLCLIGQEAKAFTMYVEIDHPENLQEVATYWTAADKTPLDLNGTMPLEATFPDEGMRYFYITPMRGCFITELSVKDEDGIEVMHKTGAWRSVQLVEIKDIYDHGTLYIKTSDKQPTDSKVSVNLHGNPENVSFSFGSRTVPLVEGQQEIEFTSSIESTAYLMPMGVTKFYKVLHNGEEVQVFAAGGENAERSFQYNISVKDNDEVEIFIDYPDIDVECTINLNDGLNGFIQSVTLNGEPVTNWKKLTAKMGQELAIKANTDDYDVESFTVNGQERGFFLGSWEQVVEEELSINITGKPIERPFTVTTKTINWQDVNDDSKGFYGYYCMRGDRKNVVIAEGDGTIKFNDAENPFTLHLYAERESDLLVKLNDRVIEPNSSGDYEMYFIDGDFLLIVLGKDAIDGIGNAITDLDCSKKNTYNIQGVQMPADKKLPAGLYIKNGKKTIIR